MRFYCRLIGPSLQEVVQADLLGLVPLIPQATRIVLRGRIFQYPQEILSLSFHARLHLQGDNHINHEMCPNVPKPRFDLLAQALQDDSQPSPTRGAGTAARKLQNGRTVTGTLPRRPHLVYSLNDGQVNEAQSQEAGTSTDRQKPRNRRTIFSRAGDNGRSVGQSSRYDPL